MLSVAGATVIAINVSVNATAVAAVVEGDTAVTVGAEGSTAATVVAAGFAGDA